MDKKDLKKENNSESVQTLPPIAVIGLAGILPEAENLNKYWENILQEVNCIKEVPSSRWKIDDYYDPDPSVPDKSYSKHGGFIPDIQFDPMEFGLPPNLLEVTDVSQLLALIVAKDALRDAGYLEVNEDAHDRTGVILGMVGMSSKVIHPLLNRLQYPVWEKVLKTSSIPEEEIPQIIEKMKLAYISWNENAFPGSIGNVVAGRIANRLDLGGTNCIVDAACGSSLAAVSMAVSELALGRADMMISGGVDTDNSILTYLCFSKTPAFSKGGHLRAFSEESDGMLVGEGIGMLILKRLEDAERDGDRIYSVIRGVGSSSDGNFKSIYAPRSSGQAKAIRRAYEQADYPPSTVRLIEAHGTGTNAGDPAEFGGLTEAFDAESPSEQVIALGSVKSQIGHTKATAGAASLIKASLALYQKTLPATINVSNPHPAMNIESTPFYLNTETRPWFKEQDDSPRRAGISSFGFGGTNFHITMEEYLKANGNEKRIRHVPFSIVLAAASPEELLEICKTSLEELTGEEAQKKIIQLDRETNNLLIPIDHARVGIVAESVEDACTKFEKCIKMLTSNKPEEQWSLPDGIYYRKSGMETEGKTAVLFPGQGAQYVNMGKDLAINFPPVRKVFEKANEIFSKSGKNSLTDVVYPIPVFSDDDKNEQSKRLTRTENAQPAIGTFSASLYRLLQEAGFQADYYAGHSFGELTALWAAGVYELDAFIRLAKARGEAMGLPGSTDQETGTMIAVKGDVEQIHGLLEGQNEVTIANFNSPSQVVLAGSTDAVQKIKQKLEDNEFTIYPLKVSAAFHTSFVEHAQIPFKEAIQQESFQKPDKAVYSNSTAQKHELDPQKIAKNLAGHILNSVQFKEEIENIYKDGGTIFVEVGPRRILSNLVKDILKDQSHEVIALNPNPKGNSDMQLRQAILQMRVLGFKLGTFDPYREYQTDSKQTQSKVAVKLNGGLYMTKKTRDAFETALDTSNSKSSAAEFAQRNLTKKPNEEYHKNNRGERVASSTQSREIASNFGEESQMNNDQTVGTFFDHIQKHQQGVLRAHELFLQNDSASKKIMQDIAAKELAILSDVSEGSQVSNQERTLSLLEKRIQSVNNQLAGASIAHQEFIRSQTEFTKQYISLLKEMFKEAGTQIPFPQPNADKSTAEVPVAEIRRSEDADISVSVDFEDEIKSPPEAASTGKLVDTKQLTHSFLQIVSEKTGYPTDMLELNMDMEADLGIDSIKRVEILGAMQEEFPQLPTIPAEDLALLRTLEQIISAFSTEPSGSSAEISVPKDTLPVSEPGIAVQDSSDSPVDIDLQTAFMDIVGEKTGYPPDMLELRMDMEADLGIDSIKKVEILGAMQEQFPKLPTIEAEDLAMLRTLEQIIEKFSSNTVKPGADISKREDSLIRVDPEPVAPEIERLAVKVKSLPRPDYLKFDMPDDGLILITDDGTEKSGLLADYYLQKNNKVGLIHFNDAKGEKDEHPDNGLMHYTISNPDEKEIKSCMEEIIEDHKKIIAFIHMNPAGDQNEKEILGIANPNADILKSVFLIARHLKKPLSLAGENSRSAFITVSQMDGRLGLNGNGSNDPIPGGLSGLTKSLRLEWKNVFCRAIDLHPDIDPQTTVQLIDDELHDPDLHLTEVGYTPEGRYTLSLNEEK